jgi:hypothetical protein
MLKVILLKYFSYGLYISMILIREKKVREQIPDKEAEKSVQKLLECVDALAQVLLPLIKVGDV